MTTIPQMLSEMLGALGFERMAQDVLTEEDRGRLCHYARIVLRQIPTAKKQEVHSRFAMLGLV